MYFETWWKYNDSVLISIHNGIIADDKHINDCLITNTTELTRFVNCIAFNIPNPENYFTFVTNKDDIFLNGKIEINFKENMLLLVTAAQIENITYSELFECYLVSVEKKSVIKQRYSIGIFKKRNRFANKFFILNEKPENLKINYPVNNNEDY